MIWDFLMLACEKKLNKHHMIQCAATFKHPCKHDEKSYFMADVPNLLKSINNCIEFQEITLPNDIVTKHALTCANNSSTLAN